MTVTKNTVCGLVADASTGNSPDLGRRIQAPANLTSVTGLVTPSQDAPICAQ